MPVRESASVRVLLISRHIQTIETVCHFMQQMAMHVETCCDLESGMRKLCHSKYEAVLVDLNDKEEALDFLTKVRGLTSHKAAVTCAIVNFSHQRVAAFQAGANFVLERPLSSSSVFRTLKAAYPLMVRERRRYFRCPVQIPTFVSIGSALEFAATSVNISEGGIAINSPTKIQVGDKLKLRLQLPGSSESLTLPGEVCWTDATGRAGIQFSNRASYVLPALQSWLAERLEDLMPAANIEVAGEGPVEATR
ncbi:MAG TPA: PilZ domain-containing protein [Terriglobales bacterium]|nr:PilZ domain-containing protein [Terriglobales bacterium]